MTGGEPPEPELLLLTGLSGAGKTAAAAALDDLGWFVVDNIPPSLLLSLIHTVLDGTDQRRIAVVADVRAGAFFGELRGALDELATQGYTPRVLFLEADDNTLVRRFESARRPHPLQGTGRVVDAITQERAKLATLRAAADLVIDTSMLNVHQFTHRLSGAFSATTVALRAVVISFGFKHGLPVDADMVADMRFIPNPHWVPELRPLTGQDDVVAQYVLDQPDARTFLDSYTELVQTVSTGYLREGKAFVSIGVGCTGGRHRSVVMSEALAQRLRAIGIETVVVHRDIERGET